MKKLLLAIAVVLFTANMANAQVSGNAIGLRFGYGAEISYQHALNNSNRLEFDLGMSGFNFNSEGRVIMLNATYQWVYGINAVEGLNWYWGVGAGVGMFWETIGLGINAQIGIEYNFPQIPLALSLDWRPFLYFGLNNGGGNYYGYNGFCLGVRYKF